MIFRALLAAVLLVGASGAAAQESSLDPSLRFFLQLRDRLVTVDTTRPRVAPRMTPGRGVRPPGLWRHRVETGPGGAPYVRALVRVVAGGEGALRSAGAWVGARAGDIVTARVPLDALPALAAEGAIRSIEGAIVLDAPAFRTGPSRAAPADASPSRTPSRGAAPLDSSRADVRVDELRSRVGDRFEGLTGRRVVVGIYDTGLDLDHGDFIGPDGRTRVLYAWDQTADGDPPGAVGDHVFDYGYDCDAGEIERGACPVRDEVGHGTHVAGIAAADGSATGNGAEPYRFTGVAPGAELIVVRGSRSLSFSSDRVVDGVAYIFARAAALGRPAVVNLSLGTQAGPHDGTTNFERALDNLTGPGRIIVASAGNAGVNGNERPPVPEARLHAQGVARAGGMEHALVVPDYDARPGPANDGAVLELWYEGADSLTLTVVTPDGREVRVPTGAAAFEETPEGAIVVDNASAGPSPLNGDHAALVVVVDADAVSVPASGRWELRVQPEDGPSGAAYHLWLVGAAFDSPVPARLDGGATNSHLVSAPGTADQVLAVAAHVTRHRWTTLGGDDVAFPIQEPRGDIAFFSSPGPRRDGALKPELSAPGKVVISALADGASLWEPDVLRFLIESGGAHAGLFGTSMAAPHVAGGIALLLQLDPRLAPEDVRQLVTLSARGDAFTVQPHTPEPGGAPNGQWGYGKLDVAAAVRRLRPQGLVAAGERVNLSQNPVRDRALLINYRDRPRSVAVYTITARRVRGFREDEIGPLSTVWALDTDRGEAVVNGAYVLVVEFEDGRVVKKIFVARP